MMVWSSSLDPHSEPYDRDCGKAVDREPARICIVASEFEGIVPNGGIGTFYSTLAMTLVLAGHQVTLLFTQGEVSRSTEGGFRYWQANYAGRGIDLVGLDKQAVNGVRYHAMTSWAAFSWLRVRNSSFDIIHFADFQGHGYYTVLAKFLGLSFANSTIVVTTHGPNRWALTANGGTLNNIELIEVDFLEQQSIRLADVLISPSKYLLQWQSLQGWTPRNPPRVMPLLVPQAAKQLVEDVVRAAGVNADDPDVARTVTELVFFGRLEVRKGIIEFCDAVDEILSYNNGVQPKITFLGSSRNTVNGRASKEYVKWRALNWEQKGVEVAVYDDKDTKGALLYLLGGDGTRCAVLPSRVENSPQAVLELMGARVPFIASSAGGIPELIAPKNHQRSLFMKRNASDLARAMVSALRDGVVVPRASRTMASLEQSWVNWHANANCPPSEAFDQQSIGARLRGVGNSVLPAYVPALPAKKDEAAKQANQAAACILVSKQHRSDLKATMLSLLDQDTNVTVEVFLVFIGIGTQEADSIAGPALRKAFLKVTVLQAFSRGAGVATCTRHSNMPYILIAEAGAVLERRAVGLMASVVHRTDVPGVTPVTHIYNEHLLFDKYLDIREIRKALVPSQQTIKLFLGPAIRLGIFQNVMGSEIVYMASRVIQRLGDIQALLGTELDFWELLAAATLHGYEIQVLPEPLCWIRFRPPPTRNIFDLKRLLQQTAHNFSLDEFSNILQETPRGVAAVMEAKEFPRAIVPDA